MKLRYIVTVLLTLPFLSFGQNYPSQEQFGKNRVQYHRFEWKVLKTNNFEVYHYDNGTPLATLTAQYAESEFERINEILSYIPINKIKIFIYNSPQEMAQSNMGMANLGNINDQALDLAKSRLEIAFSGNQAKFKVQLVREIALLAVYDMLYGGSVKDMLQSSLLMSLPDWYMRGIANYIAEGWTTELDDYMREMVQKDSFKKPSLLMGDEAAIVGQSIWNYIAERYGKDQISTILNLTRIIRTDQTSIASSLQVSYSRFLREWREFYQNMAASTNTSYKRPTGDWQLNLGKMNGALSTTHVRLSSDKKYLALATSKEGKYRVELINLETKSHSLITKGKATISRKGDVYTPLLAWQTNKAVAVIVNSDEETFLQVFDIVGNGKTKLRLERTIRDINQVADFDISDDGSTLVLSADRDGKNDIYLFGIGRASLLGLTNDLYDDSYPQFIGSSSNRVVFCSNRLKDSLNTSDKGSYKTIKNKFGIFVHDGNPRSQYVKRILDTLGTISHPMSNDGNTFYFASDYEGINNFYKYEQDIKLITQLTGFSESIQDYDFQPSSFVSIHRHGEEELLNYQSQLAVSSDTPPTPRVQSISGVPAYKTERKSNPIADAKLIEQMGKPHQMKLDSGEVDTDNYEFDADVLKSYEGRQRRTSTSLSSSSILARNRRKENITIKGPIEYKGLFINNDSRSEWLADPIKGFGFAQSITMNDLLENHIVKAGFFLSTNLRNNDIWAEYSNLSHRIDFSARYDRRGLYVNDNNANQKYRYNRLAITASYPFNNTTRVSLSPFYADTRMVDINSISSPDAASNFLGARGEFVYDNSNINGMNMMEGTRLKIRYDLFGGMAGSQGFNRLAIDVRHYQKIHRDIIFAARVSFAHSGGAAPKKSVLGGMENWIGYSKESRGVNDPLTLGVDPQSLLPLDNRDVFFVEFATNLRGFNLNHVSGTSHLLFNGELRMPLIKYFYRGPITSNFLRNFQAVAFTDIGTAWSGKSPIFNRKNTLNTDIVREDYFSATVNNFRNPFMIGYGLGARTLLFGFYLKFDYAWGLDNGDIGKPISYLTLGYDF